MQHCFFSRLSLLIFALCGGCIFATSTFAAEVEPAVPLKPDELVHIGKFAITNSMLVTWIVAAGIIVFAQLATRKIQVIPSGAQNFWEWLVESLYNFLESIIGRELVRKTFWFFALMLAIPLFAVTPQFWETRKYDDFQKGKLTNLSLTSDDELALAPRFDTVCIPDYFFDRRLNAGPSLPSPGPC